MFTKWYYKLRYKRFCNKYPIANNQDYYQLFDYVTELFLLHSHIPKWDMISIFEPQSNISIFYDTLEKWLKGCMKYKSDILRHRLKNSENLTIKKVSISEFFIMEDERQVEIISGTNAIVDNLSFFYREIMKQEKANHYYYFGQLSDILMTGIRIIEYQVHRYYA